MKEIKFILYTIIIAIYTSSWWAALKWGGQPKETALPLLWLIPILGTVAILTISVFYIVEHWNDK